MMLRNCQPREISQYTNKVTWAAVSIAFLVHSNAIYKNVKPTKSLSCWQLPCWSAWTQLINHCWNHTNSAFHLSLPRLFKVGLRVDTKHQTIFFYKLHQYRAAVDIINVAVSWHRRLYLSLKGDTRVVHHFLSSLSIVAELCVLEWKVRCHVILQYL